MDAKREDIPPPNAYKLRSMFRPFDPEKENSHEYTQEKFCSFIEEAKYFGMQSPPAKYDKNYTQIDKSPRTAVIFEESKKENIRARIRGIVKQEGVSPCHYEPLDSFKS